MKISVDNPGVVAELKQMREAIIPLLVRFAVAAEAIAAELKAEPTPTDLKIEVGQPPKGK